MQAVDFHAYYQPPRFLAQRPWLCPQRVAGYKGLRSDRPGEGRRGRASGAEGGDEGFSVWDWLVIAVGAVFIIQALFRLNASRSGRT